MGTLSTKQIRDANNQKFNQRVFSEGDDGPYQPVILANHSTTGLGDGNRLITTAGVGVVLGSAPAKWITIQAYRSNTGYIAIGSTAVSASETAGTGTGFSLAAGESITLPINDLLNVVINGTIGGDGIRYIYGK